MVATTLRTALTAPPSVLIFPGFAMIALGLNVGPLVGDSNFTAMYDIACEMPLIGAALAPFGFASFFLLIGTCKVLAVLAMWGCFGPDTDEVANALLLALPLGAAYLHKRLELSMAPPLVFAAILLARLMLTSPRARLPKRHRN